MVSLIRKQLMLLEETFWKKFRSNLRPNIMQFDYLHYLSLSRDIRESFAVVRKKMKKKRYTIIDIGCGKKPYLQLFDPYVKKYTGIDPNPHEADLVAKAEHLPIKNNQYDIAVSFQTLEHVQFPQQAINEMHRVVSRGGYVIVTTLGSWMHHPSPHDYYRWTSEGLAEIFKNFSNISIKPNLKAPASLLQLINVELYGTACRHTLVKLPIYLIIILFNIIGKLIMPYGQDHFTINYIVLARK